MIFTNVFSTAEQPFASQTHIAHFWSAAGQVVNPAFVFPYKRYQASGKDIVMYGELQDVLDGDVACAMPCRRVRQPAMKPYRADDVSPGGCLADCLTRIPTMARGCSHLDAARFVYGMM